ncbi:hypothetical protein FA13DRAFT_1153674 [Coprinellus micaceus]|uniref:Uncharacterized protein n=1 Tax=Coprinellus micaceus TaxID=71717 RepID=A0A4Y7RC94_COPMI|nr:hypothetical protein FA13DRAFT_1153674 [Coprinellus micaceus]
MTEDGGHRSTSHMNEVQDSFVSLILTTIQHCMKLLPESTSSISATWTIEDRCQSHSTMPLSCTIFLDLKQHVRYGAPNIRGSQACRPSPWRLLNGSG